MSFAGSSRVSLAPFLTCGPWSCPCHTEECCHTVATCHAERSEAPRRQLRETFAALRVTRMYIFASGGTPCSLYCSYKGIPATFTTTATTATKSRLRNEEEE